MRMENRQLGSGGLETGDCESSGAREQPGGPQTVLGPTAEPRKLRPKSYMSLKSSSSRCAAVGRGVLLNFELTPSAIRRDGDRVGLDCSGVVST